MKKNEIKIILTLGVSLLTASALPQTTFAQQTKAAATANEGVRVAGSVHDSDGEPLPGATVRVKGTKLMAMTDVNGRFSLLMKSDKRVTLVVSFIGMLTAEKQWNGKNVNIVLESSPTTLAEVAVVGYQELDRRKTTAAVTTVKMDDILMPDMTTVDQALEGRIPDLMFSQNSGSVGATARLRVRGTSTLVGNREPLWVLDGFIIEDPVNVSNEQLNDPDYVNYIGNAIAGINPQDIDRIDVLKDAAATALYGTRAANGVIVVTTKKGQEGPPTIRYSTQLKYTQRPRYSDENINLMNSQERMQFGKDLCDLHYVFPQYMPMVGYEGAYNRFQTGQTSYDQFLDEVKWYETTNTDWFDILCRDAFTQSHTISISGGNEKTRYYSSLGYTDDSGTVKSEYVKRYTAAMNLSTSFTSKLKFNMSLNANVQKKNHLPSEVNLLNYAYETTRALPAYNPDGSLFYYKKNGYGVGTGKSTNQYNYNIFNEIENTASDYSGNTIQASMQLSYKILPSLDLIAAANYSRSSTLQSTWFGERSNYAAILKNGEADDIPQTGQNGLCELPYGGVYNTTNTITENATGRVQLNFRHNMGGGSLITALAGFEASTYTSDGISDQTRGYYKDRGMQYSSLTGTDLDLYPLYKEWIAQNHRTMTAAKTNKLSGYLTLTYDYKRYFTLSLNGRFDASNKFGSRSNEKFLPVYSVSGRFDVKQTLLKEITQVEMWNIRSSFGVTGNMLDNETPNLIIRQGVMDSYYGENVSTVAAFPNPNLRWEQTRQFNLDSDATLFSGRLMLEGGIWYKHTTDAFSTVNVSTVNGRRSYNMNNGTIDNRGYSIYIKGYPIYTQDWKLYLSAGYSYASNTVQSGANENYTINDYLNGTAIVDGKAIGTFYSYRYLGLNPNTGIPMFDDYNDRRHLLANKTLAEVVPLVMMESGNRDPKLTGSIYATLTWKQLSMNMNFNYRIGSKMRLFNLYTPVMYGISSEKNVRKEFLDRWMRPGDEKHTDIPVILSPSDPNYESTMSHWTNTESAKVVDKIPAFGGNTWNMYDYSDLRVVPGDYLRLSNLMLSYQFRPAQLVPVRLKDLRLSLSVTNVFTLKSGKLQGQDPLQANSTAITMSVRPAYTFSMNVSF